MICSHSKRLSNLCCIETFLLIQMHSINPTSASYSRRFPTKSFAIRIHWENTHITGRISSMSNISKNKQRCWNTAEQKRIWFIFLLCAFFPLAARDEKKKLGREIVIASLAFFLFDRETQVINFCFKQYIVRQIVSIYTLISEWVIDLQIITVMGMEIWFQTTMSIICYTVSKANQ